jgi:hypothetical protein
VQRLKVTRKIGAKNNFDIVGIGLREPAYKNGSNFSILELLSGKLSPRLLKNPIKHQDSFHGQIKGNQFRRSLALLV